MARKRGKAVAISADAENREISLGATALTQSNCKSGIPRINFLLSLSSNVIKPDSDEGST